jgi:hypothetical protein
MIAGGTAEYIHAASYSVINNGGESIIFDIIFASAFCNDWIDKYLNPGATYVSDNGVCCLKGARIKSVGGRAYDMYVDLQGCASISGPARVNQIIFNQYANGQWFVTTGRS